MSMGNCKFGHQNLHYKITLVILVRALARKFVVTKIPFEELEAWGKEGLNEAKRRYEPSCGFKFVPYAAWFIKQNIKNEIANRTDESQTK